MYIRANYYITPGISEQFLEIFVEEKAFEVVIISDSSKISESFYKPIDVFDMKILNITFAESDQDKRAWSSTAYKTLQIGNSLV